jgi:hypothetical protein
VTIPIHGHASEHLRGRDPSTPEHKEQSAPAQPEPSGQTQSAQLTHVVLVMLLLQHLLLLQVVLLRQHRVHLRRHPLRHVLRRLGHHGLLHEVRLRWHVRRLVRLLHGVHRGARLLHHGRWEGGIGAGRRVRGGVREVTAAVRVWGLRGETTHPCRACVGGWMWSGGLT